MARFPRPATARLLVVAMGLLGACRSRTHNDDSSTKSTSSGPGAFKCDLFEKGKGEPGGGTPAVTYYTDTDDKDLAEAACRAKLKSRVAGKARKDFWLRWLEEEKLPAGWRKADLLVGFTGGRRGAGVTPGVGGDESPPSGDDTQGNTNPDEGPSAYACELIGRSDAAGGGDVSITILYSDTDDKGVAEAACKRRLGKSLNGIIATDFSLKWMEEAKLPAEWRAKDLLAP